LAASPRRHPGVIQLYESRRRLPADPGNGDVHLPSPHARTWVGRGSIAAPCGWIRPCRASRSGGILARRRPLGEIGSVLRDRARLAEEWPTWPDPLPEHVRGNASKFEVGAFERLM